MCLILAPATMAALSIATSVASAGAGLAGQVIAANQTNETYRDNAVAANAAAANRYAYEQLNLQQRRQAAEQQLFENSVKGLQARSTVRNAAGDAGVTGLSVDALVGDYYGREGRRADSIQQNYEMDRGYVLGEMDATHSQAQARINSAPRAAVGPLDVLSAGIKAASGSLSALAQYGKVQYRLDPYDSPYGLGIS